MVRILSARNFRSLLLGGLTDNNVFIPMRNSTKFEQNKDEKQEADDNMAIDSNNEEHTNHLASASKFSQSNPKINRNLEFHNIFPTVSNQETASIYLVLFLNQAMESENYSSRNVIIVRHCNTSK